jgi:two-component system sensor histidine kinase/response regulator
MNGKKLNKSDAELAALKSPTESEKLAAVLRYSPAIILTVDRQMRIQSINRVRAGLTVEDVLSTSCLDYVLPEHRVKLEAYIKKVFKTGESISYEIQGRGDHGVPAWYSTRLSLLSKGTENEQVLLVTEDITERRMVDEALHRSEKRYRTIVHNIPGMVYRVHKVPIPSR